MQSFCSKLFLLAFALNIIFTAPTVFASTFVSGGIAGDTTWNLSGSPYVIGGSLVVPQGATLTIEPGVVVKLDMLATMSVFGTLIADHAIFTSYADDAIGGDSNENGSANGPAGREWGAILVEEGGVATFTGSAIHYGGRSCQNYCGAITNRGGILTVDQLIASAISHRLVYQVSGTTTVTNSTLSGGDCGVWATAGSFTIGHNDFEIPYCAGSFYGTVQFHNIGGNTGIGGYLFTSVASVPLSGSSTWIADGIPYLPQPGFMIPSDASLTIAPGALVKLSDTGVTIYGTLTASDVTFTSLRDDSVGGDTNADGGATTPAPSDWSGMLNYGTLTLKHDTIHYGGRQFNAIAQIAGTSTITNSDIAYANTGVQYQGGGLIVTHNNLHDLGYGVYNQSALTTIDATHNYWGDTTGPLDIYANPNGKGSGVSGFVSYIPFDTSDQTEAEVGCTVDCYSNVMFLPGIEGSRLYDSSGNRRWLSSGDADADYIRMNSDGISVFPDITTKDAIDTADFQQLYTDIYKSFLVEMKTWENEYSIIATTTPYDWRLNYDSVVNNGRKLPSGQISYLLSPETGHDPYIIETLKQLAASSPTGKVTIIGHSQGGLIAKALMQKIGAKATAELVDKVIFVATPQLGTPQAVATILHGTDAGIVGAISESKVRQLAQNFPSAYTLLPSDQYFQYVDDSVINIDQATLPDWATKYGTTTHSTIRLSNFMLDNTRTKPILSDLATPEIGNPTLFQRAQDSHISLDSWVPPIGVQLITIAGWGEETLSGINYVGVKDCIKTSQVIIQGSVSVYCTQYQIKPSLKVNHVVDGDGTVVETSALWANGASSTRYWVNLPNYNSENILEASLLGRNHKNILEVSQLRNLITGIISSSTKSIGEYSYISTVAPASNKARLNFTLHSPLTLGFTDNFGNYTGSTATTSVFSILGVQYKRYGDVQWLSVSKELAGQLVLRGVSAGSFTLDVEEVNGNNVFATTSFEGIPSSSSTVVTMLINPRVSPTASSSLVIDEDGNGTPDITLQAEQNNVVFLPIPTDINSPVTTTSSTGTLGINNWYISNVVITLSATDTESGVASTSYSINGGTTWSTYTAPFSINTEGNTTILYRSIDKAGNSEAIKMFQIKIDKTAPEAQISVGTSTQDIVVTGVDNFGTTTTMKDISGNITLIDGAGHTTKLSFIKSYSGKLLTYAKLTGVQYDVLKKITLPSSSFLYIWDNKTPSTLLSQTITVDNNYLIQAMYDKVKNKTTIIVLKKNLPIQVKTFTGIETVKVTTLKGVVGYSF